MKKWTRARYQPGIPLDGRAARATASPEHLALSREAACEGMVLLKNENEVLPLCKGAKVALFGKGVFDYVKGGGGSGDVTVAHVRNLYDGLTLGSSRAEIFAPLAEYYRKSVAQQYAAGSEPGMLVEPAVPEDLLAEAKSFTDTAILVISRFSGEGWDRRSSPSNDQTPNEIRQSALAASVFENSDFCLTNAENALLAAVTQAFAKVIVVLNTGGMMETAVFAENPAVSSLLLAWQGGMEGGMAMADILFGDAVPSGKLPDTMARTLEDYPSTDSFLVSPKYVTYTEDIYVGYRYFATIPGAADKVVYPFGFGLSYTSFETLPVSAAEADGNIVVTAQVTNTGKCAGKEVIQLYYSAPQGKLGKAARELGAFAKTKLLAPGETQFLTLSFPAEDMASFDDLGKIRKSAYVLEQGVYSFYLGNNVRDAAELGFHYGIEEDIITQQLTSRMTPAQLPSRMLSDGSMEALPQGTPIDFTENAIGWEGYDPGFLSPAVRAAENLTLFGFGTKYIMLDDVAAGKATLADFMAQLSLDDKIHLLGGQPNTGVANTFGFGNIPKFGIPNIMTADGPAGLRILPECEVCTTAWPVATMLCASWNKDLIQAVGKAAAEEVKENNVSVWLAPAVNIHRSPLCGRNFEYYSEDPLLAGVMATALIQGVQSQGVSAEVKHFCCNNKESNRKNSDSRVSERALREIYLKQFEIIIKASQPWALMTSYNLVNACRCSENKELLDGILREEWGYEGVVTTDWWTYGEHYKEVKAGNDIKMAAGFPDRVRRAYDIGAITEAEIDACAKRVLELILKVD